VNPLDPADGEARILVAEADAVTRMFLADNLTADGYAVQAVADHQTAIAQLRDRAVDLILADVTGQTLALLDTIRNAQASAHAPSDLPVIGLTANLEELHRVRLLERGCDDVIGRGCCHFG
jgi:DNA-binding response OmpR family regulator